MKIKNTKEKPFFQKYEGEVCLIAGLLIAGLILLIFVLPS